MLIEARLIKSVRGYEAGDSLLAHPALGSHLALVRLIETNLGHLLDLDTIGALEYLGGPILPTEVERMLTRHFRTLEARARGIALLR